MVRNLRSDQEWEILTQCQSTTQKARVATQESENDEAASSDLSKLALNTPSPSDNLYAEFPPGRLIGLLKLFPGAGQDAIIIELTVYPLANAVILWK